MEADEKKPLESKGSQLDPARRKSSSRSFSYDNLNTSSDTPWFPKEASWRAFVFRILDSTTSSRCSTIFSLISSMVVVISCVSLVLSSMPEYRYPRYGTKENDTTKEFDQIEMMCTIFFTVEYILRIGLVHSVPMSYVTGRSKIVDIKRDGVAREMGPIQVGLYQTWKFIIQPLNIVDLLAIVPFYLEGLGSNVNLTSLRIARLVRLAKLFKRNRMIPLLVTVLERSADMLFQVSIILTIYVVFMACLIFLCEGGEYNSSNGKYERRNLWGEKEETPFTSVYISIWWVMVTFTTVGYGDMSPTTSAGRVVGSMIVVIGLVMIAVPITIITGVFIEEYHNDRTSGDETSIETMHMRTLVLQEGRILDHELRSAAEETLRGAKNIGWLPIKGSCQEKLFTVWEDVKSCKLAYVCVGLVATAIILSSVSLTIESLPRYRYPNYGSKEGDTAPAFGLINAICVAIFTVELICKCIGVFGTRNLVLMKLGFSSITDDDGTCLKVLRWLFHPVTVVDLMSTIPFYIELALPGTPSLTFFRILRLLRMMRILRLAGSLKGLRIMAAAIDNSLEPLANLSILLIVWVVFNSSIIFYTEQGTWNEDLQYYERETFFGEMERSPFTSILATFWWMVVTMTTVGYGDLYPTSLAGRIIGSFVLFFSIICFAIPIALVGVSIEDAVEMNEKENRELETHPDIEKVVLGGEIPSVEYHKKLTKAMDNLKTCLSTINELVEFHTYHIDPKQQRHNNKGRMLVDDIVKVHLANISLSPSTLKATENCLLSFRRHCRETELKIAHLLNAQSCLSQHVLASRNVQSTINLNRFVKRNINTRTCFLLWRAQARKGGKRKQVSKLELVNLSSGNSLRNGVVRNNGQQLELKSFGSPDATVGLMHMPSRSQVGKDSRGGGGRDEKTTILDKKDKSKGNAENNGETLLESRGTGKSTATGFGAMGTGATAATTNENADTAAAAAAAFLPAAAVASPVASPTTTLLPGSTVATNNPAKSTSDASTALISPQGVAAKQGKDQA